MLLLRHSDTPKDSTYTKFISFITNKAKAANHLCSDTIRTREKTQAGVKLETSKQPYPNLQIILVVVSQYKAFSSTTALRQPHLLLSVPILCCSLHTPSCAEAFLCVTTLWTRQIFLLHSSFFFKSSFSLSLFLKNIFPETRIWFFPSHMKPLQWLRVWPQPQAPALCRGGRRCPTPGLECHGAASVQLAELQAHEGLQQGTFI